MRTRKIGKWSLSLTAAFLVAATSTLSAQAAESKGGPMSLSSATGSAGSVGFVDSGSTLSGQGAVQVQPLTSGTCGTDVAKPVAKPFDLRHQKERLHLKLLAAAIHSLAQGFPAHPAIRLAAYRLWLQSTIDVLPPF